VDILINKEKVNFTENDFPILIHGYCKTGASHFSVFLSANLLKNNMKVLFFTAYPEAKEEFRKEINNNETNAIVIDSGEEKVFIETLKNTPDLSERVILIKNMENYSPELFNAIKDLKLVIFSGNLDECKFADKLIKKNFSTKIFFSQSKIYPQDGLTELAKYTAKVTSDKYKGIISLGE
jgi:hypothetical protein